MEKIISIEETSFTNSDSEWASYYAGFVITTDKQQIKMGIQDDQSCEN